MDDDDDLNGLGWNDRFPALDPALRERVLAALMAELERRVRRLAGVHFKGRLCELVDGMPASLPELNEDLMKGRGFQDAVASSAYLYLMTTVSLLVMYHHHDETRRPGPRDQYASHDYWWMVKNPRLRRRLEAAFPDGTAFLSLDAILSQLGEAR